MTRAMTLRICITFQNLGAVSAANDDLHEVLLRAAKPRLSRRSKQKMTMQAELVARTSDGVLFETTAMAFGACDVAPKNLSTLMSVR
jgi:hypothetical protein